MKFRDYLWAILRPFKRRAFKKQLPTIGTFTPRVGDMAKDHHNEVKIWNGERWVPIK